MGLISSLQKIEQALFQKSALQELALSTLEKMVDNLMSTVTPLEQIAYTVKQTIRILMEFKTVQSIHLR